MTSTFQTHLSLPKHQNPALLCQYIPQKAIKVSEAQNCTLIKRGEFKIFFSPSKKKVCVLSENLLLLYKQQRTKKFFSLGMFYGEQETS